MGPKLCECHRQGQAEVVSNSSKKIHQTWGPPFSRVICDTLWAWDLLSKMVDTRLSAWSSFVKDIDEVDAPETDSMIAWLVDCDRDVQHNANRR